MNTDSVIDIVILDLWDHRTRVVARHNVFRDADWDHAISEACDLAGHVSTANGTDTEWQIYVVEQPVQPLCEATYSVARIHPDGTGEWDQVRADTSRDAVHGWFAEVPF